MYVNIINLMGARLDVDSEAEYRLMVLGKDIVKARRAITDISLSLKDAYGSSLLGDNAGHNVQLGEALRHCSDAKVAWASVKREATECARWFNGNVRPEYADAFTQVARNDAFRTKLANVGATDTYMNWAFESVRDASSNKAAQQEANVINCFVAMADHADAVIASTDEFLAHLRDLSRDNDFLLFKHVFQCLAVEARKPELFLLDEKCFLAVNRFEILYEAVEQITREAHTLIPGSHNQVYKNFDLKFTEPRAAP